MPIALLSLGSNVDPETHLRAAIAALRARFDDLVVSAVYRFPAVGYIGPDFLNAAATLRTDLTPAALNDWLHTLEDAHGRDRSGPRYSDRTLDIDIVLFDDAVLSGAGNLRIPRDELRHAFVLRPAAEIAPDWTHPVDGTPLAQLWNAHADRDTVFARVDGLDADAPG
ncbi:2-amino-4-hydroxy-6-hydroxymethyldihydropteridine diphosphokinase [Luteimonas fraxinea]|uniref:2-amino-4-hydroxy-6-hydroxymethyldihydropteridine pyrophosphokinase n=1 Tax=Luteimonas fraxinea TaxID=2901869 RepID=A0ABS8UCJ5_9GAMM|nr:2-amino-4-hydroxy-6-hydroxymethyldihydropteridine diphosphokinase [Luteimonas fraxinea]MCD9097236.1 2-amino-4-hydroxy-6-hydroxymethyldihydropteridine diphosphokinase [Luteimonas fraxinea]MCD9125199.1 2-amino-4-hydroxy-6-hydroxymethyldihydropteridine diphosphokinase [Luteimonas fraxinea]UHH11502.1 2-amino-4-hydroxy-6-hydroxymethyldihydropteridine diphosphokinase [Luteimonas fraxinea]